MSLFYENYAHLFLILQHNCFLENLTKFCLKPPTLFIGCFYRTRLQKKAACFISIFEVKGFWYRRIQNPINHLRSNVLFWKNIKTLNFRSLTGFWKRLWKHAKRQKCAELNQCKAFFVRIKTFNILFSHKKLFFGQ